MHVCVQGKHIYKYIGNDGQLISWLGNMYGGEWG
jgi:hypothetical protein